MTGSSFAERYPQLRDLEQMWRRGEIDSAANLVADLAAEAPQEPAVRIIQALQVLHEAGVERGDRLGEKEQNRVMTLVGEAVDLAPSDAYVLLPATMITFKIHALDDFYGYLIRLRDHMEELRDDEDHAAVAYLIGAYALKVGNTRVAEEQLASAVHLDPHDADHLDEFVRFLADRGEVERARCVLSHWLSNNAKHEARERLLKAHKGLLGEPT